VIGCYTNEISNIVKCDFSESKQMKISKTVINIDNCETNVSNIVFFQLRPPQPAVYLFLLDVSFNAVETGFYFLFSL